MFSTLIVPLGLLAVLGVTSQKCSSRQGADVVINNHACPNRNRRNCILAAERGQLCGGWCQETQQCVDAGVHCPMDDFPIRKTAGALHCHEAEPYDCAVLTKSWCVGWCGKRGDDRRPIWSDGRCLELTETCGLPNMTNPLSSTSSTSTKVPGAQPSETHYFQSDAKLIPCKARFSCFTCFMHDFASLPIDDASGFPIACNATEPDCQWCQQTSTCIPRDSLCPSDPTEVPLIHHGFCPDENTEMPAPVTPWRLEEL